MVWSVAGSKIFWMYVFSASLDVNLSGSVNVMLEIHNISKEGGVFLGILMKWVSVLQFLEMVVKVVWTDNLDEIEVLIYYSIFFNMFLEKYLSFFWKSLISSFLCSPCRLRSIGAMQSSASMVSKGVNFIALSMNISAPSWATSVSLRYLMVCMVCYQMILPYSNLVRMKDLKIWMARSRPIFGNSVSLLYALFHLSVIFAMKTE